MKFSDSLQASSNKLQEAIEHLTKDIKEKMETAAASVDSVAMFRDGKVSLSFKIEQYMVNEVAKYIKDPSPEVIKIVADVVASYTDEKVSATPQFKNYEVTVNLVVNQSTTNK
jgi:TRAP-type mannitol/chloroaromatic compound transport system substrate-binding protein